MIARLSQLLKLTCTALLALLLFGFGGRVQIGLSDLHAVDCPDSPEYRNLPMSGASAAPVHCFLLEGTLHNSTQRTLYNADLFGRIYDASGNDVWPERTRIGAVEEVPPGDSTFSIRTGVPSTNPLPIELKQFKVMGFNGRVNR
ncbi:hypothetical protein [Synechococcus sp. PCC 7336]|uniref:hypothetical protein n=1 Tax=Synechococcus sp. PCC 7336 TaxID=195250 RepID=UPI00034D6AA2|nr:hypothetical protein [Synechococcus sp. PCC 7336]